MVPGKYVAMVDFDELHITSTQDTVLALLLGHCKAQKVIRLFSRIQLGLLACWISGITILLLHHTIPERTECIPEALIHIIGLLGSIYALLNLLAYQVPMIRLNWMTFEAKYLVGNLVGNSVLLIHAVQFDMLSPYIFLMILCSYLCVIFMDGKPAGFSGFDKQFSRFLNERQRGSTSISVNEVSSPPENPQLQNVAERANESFDISKIDEQTLAHMVLTWLESSREVKSTLWGKLMKKIEIANALYPISIYTLPVVVSVFVQILLFVIIHMRLIKHQQTTTLLEIPIRIDSDEMLKFTCVNIAVFSVKRLFLMIYHPTLMICYRKNSMRVPCASSWRSMPNIVNSIPANVGSHVRNLSSNSQPSFGHLDEVSAQAEGSSQVKQPHEISPFNYTSSVSQDPCKNPHDCDGVRNSEGIPNKNNRINQHQANSQADIISLESKQNNRRQRFLAIISIPQDRVLVDFETLLCHFLPSSISPSLTYLADKITPIIPLLWISSVCSYVVWFFHPESTNAYIASLILSYTSVVGLLIYTSQFSMESVRHANFCFENVFLSCNLVVIMILGTSYLKWDQPTSYSIMLLLVLSYQVTLWRDASPIAFRQFDAKLQDFISQTSSHPTTIPFFGNLASAMKYMGIPSFESRSSMISSPSTIAASARNKRSISRGQLPRTLFHSRSVSHSIRTKVMRHTFHPSWSESRILSDLSSPSVWVNETLSLVAIMILLLLLNYESYPHTNEYSIKTSVGRFSNVGLLRTCVFNILLFKLKQVFRLLRNPFCSASFESSFIKVPLCDSLLRAVWEEQLKQKRYEYQPQGLN